MTEIQNTSCPLGFQDNIELPKGFCGNTENCKERQVVSQDYDPAAILVLCHLRQIDGIKNFTAKQVCESCNAFCRDFRAKKA